MNATISLDRSKGLVVSLAGWFATLLALTTVLGSAVTAEAATFYANGNNINLASGRSNTYSSSPAVGGYGPNLLAPLYPSYPPIEYRVTDPVGPQQPYWQVNFPRPYEVSSAYLETFEDGASINTIDVHTTTDGINWINQGTSPPVVHDGNGNKINYTFPAVSNVVGVRLVSSSFDTSAHPGIIRAVRITGPNTSLPINNAAGPFSTGFSEFSITQSTWNGGSVQSAVNWAPYGVAPPAIPGNESINDYTSPNWNYGQTIYKHQGAGDPTPIDILLNDNYLIDSVAIVTGTETAGTGRTTEAVDIYYSPGIAGAFIPILINVPLTGDPLGYYEIPLGGMFDARRIRYDFYTSGQADGTFISELYAFAVFTAVPEPATGTLLMVGLGLLAVKRRRRFRTSRVSRA